MQDEPRDYIERLFFWISLVLLVAFGGATALLLGADTALEAGPYGFGAPEIVSRLLFDAKPKPGLVSERPSTLRR